MRPTPRHDGDTRASDLRIDSRDGRSAMALDVFDLECDRRKKERVPASQRHAR